MTQFSKVDFLSVSRVVATHLLGIAVIFCAHYCIDKDLKDVRMYMCIYIGVRV